MEKSKPYQTKGATEHHCHHTEDGDDGEKSTYRCDFASQANKTIKDGHHCQLAKDGDDELNAQWRKVNQCDFAS